MEEGIALLWKVNKWLRNKHIEGKNEKTLRRERKIDFQSTLNDKTGSRASLLWASTDAT